MSINVVSSYSQAAENFNTSSTPETFNKVSLSCVEQSIQGKLITRYHHSSAITVCDEQIDITFIKGNCM